MCENQQPGSTGWQLPWADGYTLADDTKQQIKGYASAPSVNRGQSLTFYVSVSVPQTYTLDLYRLGWYDGLGGRLMLHLGPLSGTPQPACPSDPTTGMIACNWAPAYTLAVPTTWTSGIYVGVLTNAQKFQNYIDFVVRDDARHADFLYQQSVTTYQAYNNYPNDRATGKSLYDFNSYGATTVTGFKSAAKVSFDRPYANDGSGDLFKYGDVNLVRWLEQEGYDVAYATDVDTDLHGGRLLHYKGFLSTGHDEYYSANMYDAVQNARDHGVNLAFLGANDIYWQIRFEPSADGVPDRVEVCYKGASVDPIHGATTTVAWRNPVINRPEQPLIGLDSDGEVSQDENTPYVIHDSANWVYTRSGFKDGDRVSGVVGYEVDKQNAPSYPLPTANPGTYALLSNSPFVDKNGEVDSANSSIYQAPSGAWVFAAGTISWGWALDNYAHASANPGIQIMTANILDTFRNGGTPPPSGLTATAVSDSQIALHWTETARNATGYIVQRSRDDSVWSTVTALPSHTAHYTDSGLVRGIYFYRVKATNRHGDSDYSNTAASPPTATAPPLFSDTFDTQRPGAVVTGRGNNQFTAVVGGRALTVQRAVVASPPRALAVDVSADSHHYVYKHYRTSYTAHHLTFNLLLGHDFTLAHTGSYLILAQTGLGGRTKVGRVDVVLPRSRQIRLDYYDGKGIEHSLYGRGYVLPVGSWHRVGLQEIGGRGTGSLTLQVDGTTVVDSTALDTGSRGITQFAVGDVGTGNAAGHLYVDDVTTAVDPMNMHAP